jgi:hypothetical protein
MHDEDHEAPPTPSRRLIGVALAAGLMIVLSLSVFLVTRQDEVRVNEPRLSSTSVGSSTTSVRRNSRTEIVGRLKSILKTRDEAFRNRAADMLNDVYTVDCPLVGYSRLSIGSTSNRIRER